MTIDRKKLIDAYPIKAFLAKRDVECVERAGKIMALCPFHDDKTPSMSVDETKSVWFCHACGFGGSIIDFYMRRNGVSTKQAIHDLAEQAGLLPDQEASRKVATYKYCDHLGREVMQVERIEQGDKKRFRQTHKTSDGKTVNNVNGVQKILFRLERWAGKEEVCLCEGEKCVQALEALGFDATTNPGGSGAWIDAYSSYLADKHVDIWPDNDEPGEKWLKAVLQSLEGKVASLRVIRVPEIYGDIADLVMAQGVDGGGEMVMKLLENVPRISRGVMLPLLSAEECYELYVKRVGTLEEEGVDLSKWLPSFKSYTRLLSPGDVVVVLSDTGAGKTTILTNIAYSQKPLPCLFFELELSPEPMTERFIARDYQIETLNVEGRVRSGEQFKVNNWNHVYICTQTKLSLDDMETIVMRSELKIQEKPRIILVDYIGLIGGSRGKRYEHISNLAEGMKLLARTTNTVVIIASQIFRDNQREEVRLHDARDSSSIENSAQLVLGAWRPSVDRIDIKILKQTKRAGQHTVHCIFDGDRQMISEVTPDETGRKQSEIQYP